jgi:hypothetical protein
VLSPNRVSTYHTHLATCELITVYATEYQCLEYKAGETKRDLAQPASSAKSVHPKGKNKELGMFSRNTDSISTLYTTKCTYFTV